MTLIDSYIAGYERQFDYWASLAARARDLVEEEVHGSGIRAIVTSRAKSIDRLRMKLVQRSRTKDYQCHEDIERDIVDRAGVRVALFSEPASRSRENHRQIIQCSRDEEFPGPSPREARRSQVHWIPGYPLPMHDYA